ncbi:MAG: hypothetical protein V1733_01145 [bacterium]
MDPTKIASQFSSLTGNVKQYIWQKFELFRLMAAEKVALLTTHIILTLILFILSLFLIFFLALSFIFWYGEYIGPMYEAALMVSGFFLLVSIATYLLRYQLFINPLVSRLSNLILEEETDEDE